ncbi:hypothetical protein OIU84_029119 [Salix udensis]|uniref:Uncharacterized protein n=1 Tax=Salix udensis TaxID=889485 RepID=A0AAD6K8Q5_9ROSI|nr:hypothetical protein OIU84_029119 [Salix udensis]
MFLTNFLISNGRRPNPYQQACSMRSRRTFTNIRAHAQPYFYTVDLIKFGRGTLQEKKMKGSDFHTAVTLSRTTSKNYRLQITVEGVIKNILRHLIPEEASFLGTFYPIRLHSLAPEPYKSLCLRRSSCC